MIPLHWWLNDALDLTSYDSQLLGSLRCLLHCLHCGSAIPFLRHDTLQFSRKPFLETESNFPVAGSYGPWPHIEPSLCAAYKAQARISPDCDACCLQPSLRTYLYQQMHYSLASSKCLNNLHCTKISRYELQSLGQLFKSKNIWIIVFSSPTL